MTARDFFMSPPFFPARFLPGLSGSGAGPECLVSEKPPKNKHLPLPRSGRDR